MSAGTEELTRSVDNTLLREARLLEVRLAYVRGIGTTLTAGILLVNYLLPRQMVGTASFPAGVLLLQVGICVVSVAIAVVLRRGWYRPWLRAVLPIMDGGLILLLSLTILWTVFRPGGPGRLNPASLAAIVAVNMLLAVTGGLRLARFAAVLTSGLALGNFLIVAYVIGLRPGSVAAVCGLILSGGVLGFWMTEVVRRAVISEVGRMILKRFLPERVIDEAHHDPTALITEPRSLDATILVSDLRGFTSIAEHLTPAGVLEFLNEFQGVLAAAVREHGGTVDKFIGDGMLAIFGAPEPLADHAACGLAAAAAMVRAIGEVNTARVARGLVPVRVGIGVHSGSVVVGCLGSGARLEFTVIGDTVNTASRLEALTKEHEVEVLVSDDTVQRVPDGRRPLLHSIGDVAIRGRQQALRIHTFTRLEKMAEETSPVR